MGGSRQTQTQVSERDPWGPSQPLLNNVINQAQTLGGNVSNFTPTFSGSTMAGVQGLERLANQPMAQQGVLSNLIGGTQRGFDVSNDVLMRTAGGPAAANPYLDNVLKTASQRAADQVNAQFSGAGRFGSGAHAGILSDRLGSIETQARFDDYNNERTRQINAAGLLHNAGMQGAQLSGQLDNANIAQNGMMLQAGALRDQMDSAVRTAPMNAVQWQAGLGLPIAGVGGSQRGTTTTSTPANIGGMIGSGLMTGLGVMTGNPMMAVGGLSGLGSAFGGGGGASGGGFGFGSQPSYSQPGSAANGGWSTTATPASQFGFGRPFFGAFG